MSCMFFLHSSSRSTLKLCMVFDGFMFYQLLSILSFSYFLMLVILALINPEVIYQGLSHIASFTSKAKSQYMISKTMQKLFLNCK